MHHTAKGLSVESDKNKQKGFTLAQGAKDSDTQSPAHVHGLNRDLLVVTFKAGYQTEIICQHGCDAKFSSVEEAKYHLQSVHFDEGSVFERPKCEYKAALPSSITKHAVWHLDARPHQCSVCPKAFKDAGGLAAHKKIHNGQRPYVCDESGCDDVLKRKAQLVNHAVVHTDERPF